MILLSTQFKSRYNLKYISIPSKSHAFGFADAIPDEAADGAIDFLAFFFCQVQCVKNDVVQLGAIRHQL